MGHPKDRSGLTRRQLLRGAAGGALAPGRRRRPRGLREHDRADRRLGGRPGRSRGEARRAEAGRPGRPAAPAAGQRGHLGDHRRQPADQGRPAGRAGTAQRLQLRRLHRPGDAASASRSSYGVSVKIATYNSSDEAIAKLAAGAVGFDVIIGPGRLEHRQPDRAEAPPAAQPLVPARTSTKNIWPELQDPFYDRGSRYTVPYVVWMDGIGWRNDKVKEDIAGDGRPLGHLLAVAGLPRQGRASSTTSATRSSMPMQRDAMRTAASGPTSTPRTRRSIARAGETTSQQLNGICNIKVTITDYQTLPEGQEGPPPRPGRATC